MLSEGHEQEVQRQVFDAGVCIPTRDGALFLSCWGKSEELASVVKPVAENRHGDFENASYIDVNDRASRATLDIVEVVHSPG